MKSFLRATLDGNGRALMPCAVGEQVQLLALATVIGGVTLGEVATVSFVQSNGTLAFSVSDGMTAVCTNVSAGIGLPNSTPLPSSTSLVNGTHSFSDTTAMSMGLPDIWFDRDTLVNFTLPAASFTSGTIYYVKMKLSS